jgi:hypothetical protein
MHKLTSLQIKQLAHWFLCLLPEQAHRACQIAAVLYDERVVVLGVTTPSARTLRLEAELQAARTVAEVRLNHKVAIKWTVRGAFVILPAVEMPPDSPTGADRVEAQPKPMSTSLKGGSHAPEQQSSLVTG